MQEFINRLIIEINSHDDWSILEKVRYAYLNLGKKIHLNIEFFYSIYGVTNDHGYNLEELKEIYSNTKPTSNVICKDSAQMLKMIFDGCGIHNEIIITHEGNHDINGENFSVRHFFNVVTDEQGKKYFLTLNPDLANIQNGLKTEHFGTDIIYMDDRGMQVYEGEQINNTVLTDEELKEIDEKLGYLQYQMNGKLDYTNVTFDYIEKVNRNYQEYLELLTFTKKNMFYSSLISLFRSESREYLELNKNNLTEKNIKNVKNYIVGSVYGKLKDEASVSLK